MTVSTTRKRDAMHLVSNESSHGRLCPFFSKDLRCSAIPASDTVRTLFHARSQGPVMKLLYIPWNNRLQGSCGAISLVGGKGSSVNDNEIVVGGSRRMVTQSAVEAI